MQFQKATKHDAKLRMSLIGPSGSGKTYTALALAANIAGPVALVDTERGSAAKYADQFDFDVLTLDDFHPQKFIDAIHAASKAGYGTLIIDSLSHAWMGKGGALELVDKAQAASKGGNSFMAWKSVTPLQTEMIDAILRAPLHVIVTLRAKTEYVVEQNERGKSAPRKIGTAPIQRDGIEYEFDVVADLDQDNNFIVTKTRCPELQGQVFKKAGADVAGVLTKWLHGAPVVLATAAEITRANDIRIAAVNMGYLTSKGTIPNEVVPEIPQKVLLERQGKWQFWIDSAAERDAGNPPEIAPSTPVGHAAEPGADVLTDAQHRTILAIANRVFGRPATAEDFAQLADKPLENLTKGEASELIDRLRYRLAENQSKGQAEPPVNRASEPRNAARRPRNVEHESQYSASRK